MRLEWNVVMLGPGPKDKIQVDKPAPPMDMLAVGRGDCMIMAGALAFERCLERVPIHVPDGPVERLADLLEGLSAKPAPEGEECVVAIHYRVLLSAQDTTVD